MIHEIINNELSIETSPFNLDRKLDTLKDPLPDPLPNTSFIWGIFGRPRSGKSTYLLSLLMAKKKKGIRQSYIGLFKNIIFVSPTIHSITDKRIQSLKFKYDNVSVDILTEIEDLAKENKEDNEQTLVIFDDCSTQFKKNRGIEQKLTQICKNHRHLGLSIFILSQKFTDLTSGMRLCLPYMTIFTMDNLYERDSLFSELPIKKKDYDPLYEYIFQNKDDDVNNHNSFMLDMSRTRSNHIRLFKNFNELKL